MLIFRYLAKEVFVALASLTTILLLIFMSNQFVRYLNRAASGNIPGVIIMKLMMLELPTLIGLLLPLGFYVAILIAYGRMYADSEMTVLRSCGYSSRQLMRHSFILAFFVAATVGAIMIWASPVIATERARLLETSGVKTMIQTIIPGRFQSLSGGTKVFYVEAMSRDHNEAKNIFLARQGKKGESLQWEVLFAKKAYAETDARTREDYIVLKDGKEYEGIPGQADYRIAEFGEYRARLPHPVISIENDIRTARTATLLPYFNPDLKKAAELQWRISVPVMVLILTLIAVPLSRVDSRSGKFAKLLPAIIIYILYANFMFIGRDAIIDSKVPVWLGMWWLHGLFLSLGLFLIWREKVKLS